MRGECFARWPFNYVGVEAMKPFERFLLYTCSLVIAGMGYAGYCAYAEYAPRVIDTYQKIQKIEKQLEKLRLFREDGDEVDCKTGGDPT
jgi:hypothetical protein